MSILVPYILETCSYCNPNAPANNKIAFVCGNCGMNNQKAYELLLQKMAVEVSNSTTNICGNCNLEFVAVEADYICTPCRIAESGKALNKALEDYYSSGRLKR